MTVYTFNCCQYYTVQHTVYSTVLNRLHQLGTEQYMPILQKNKAQKTALSHTLSILLDGPALLCCVIFLK